MSGGLAPAPPAVELSAGVRRYLLGLVAERDGLACFYCGAALRAERSDSASPAGAVAVAQVVSEILGRPHHRARWQLWERTGATGRRGPVDGRGAGAQSCVAWVVEAHLDGEATGRTAAGGGGPQPIAKLTRSRALIDIVAAFAFSDAEQAEIRSAWHPDVDPTPAAVLDLWVPLARGGTWDPTNLVLACQGCRTDKHTLTGDEYQAVLTHRYQHRPRTQDRRRPPSAHRVRRRRQATATRRTARRSPGTTVRTVPETGTETTGRPVRPVPETSGGQDR